MKLFLIREEHAHPGKFVLREYRFLTGGDVVPIAPVLAGTIEGARSVVPGGAKKIERPMPAASNVRIQHIEAWVTL